MKYIILGLFSIILFFTSCRQPKEKKDIIASFPPNDLDYNIPPKCGENEAYFNKDSEIVLIKAIEFNSIIDRLENLKPSKESNACSSDFSFFVGEDKYCSCIYDERLMTKNGQLFEISDTLLFDLKTALTYYNSRTKENLKYDPLIQKFGLPQNYKFQRAEEASIIYDEKGNEEVSILDFKFRLVTLSGSK
ncbi:MAG: hypothetical protein KIG88_08220 [Weeksellaceae bacterium]|nr:hypothetical protein [Weeksellaceae bacterium]